VTSSSDRIQPMLDADEARPPEISSDQAIAAAQEGELYICLLAGFLLSFE
jgi:hypothetical protein